MKVIKIIIYFFLIGFCHLILAQNQITEQGSITTLNPSVESQGERSVRVQKIEITKSYTIVSFVHTNLSQGEMWIQIMPSIKIIGAFGKRTFKFIKTEGIPVAPEKFTYTKYGQRKYFRVYFEKLDPGIEKVDIFECTNTDLYVCFNFYGVKIKNPITQIAPTVVNKNGPAINNSNIIIQGKVLNSKTQKPVACQINFQFASNRKQIASVQSNALGYYKMVLKGGYFYNCTASAKGYLVSEETINTSKFTPNKVFICNFLLKPVEVGETIRLHNIYFAQAEFKVLDASYNELDKLAKIMQSNPTMEILIEGHTDIIGNENDNLVLSQKRVNAVKEYLVKKGIAEKRIQTKAYGGTKPLKTDGTDQDRQVNRRVEFKILKK